MAPPDFSDHLHQFAFPKSVRAHSKPALFLPAEHAESALALAPRPLGGQMLNWASAKLIFFVLVLYRV
jgi:hypothetical protein